MLERIRHTGQRWARRSRLWRAVHWPASILPLERTGVACQWLSVDPPILLAAHWRNERQHSMYSLDPVFRRLKSRSAWFLYLWNWHIADEAQVILEARIEHAHRQRYPGHRFIHLCNSRQQFEAFTRLGLDAVLCSHNCLVDERIYHPMPGIPKHYDAVHNARLKRYKRHELATGIRSLALIYAHSPNVDAPQEMAAIRRGLPQAHFYNHDSEGNYRNLSDSEVCLHLNECRVGLCLSAVEGAMYASMEYLLCGLPVVSTESLGGRDLFFDEVNAVIVEPTPGAVRAGVEAMLARNPHPEVVRQRALARVLEQRGTFIETVQAIFDGEQVLRRFEDEFPRMFYNRFRRFQSHAEILRPLDSGSSTKPGWKLFLQGQRKRDRWVGLMARIPWLGPKACHHIGLDQLGTGDSLAAVATFERALAAGLPAHTGIHHHLGLALMNNGHPDDAERAFRAAIASRPDATWSYQELGVVLMARGRLDEAESVLRQGLQRRAGNLWLSFHLSHCVFAQGRIEAALDLMLEAWAAAKAGPLPGLPFPVPRIDPALCTASRVATLRKLARALPGEKSPIEVLAWMLLQLQKFDEAITVRRKFAAIHWGLGVPRGSEPLFLPFRAQPDFLIIGQTKAGTSALYTFLCQHPQVVAATTKEVEFWSLFNAAGDAWYQTHFLPQPAGSSLLTGEATAGYLHHPLVPDRVAKALPQVKVIVMLRDPVARAWSHYQMNRRIGIEDREWEDIVADAFSSAPSCPLTEEAVRANLTRAPGKSYFLMSAPLPFLQRWLTLLPRRQILILQYAAFQSDGTGTLGLVHRFLGLRARDTDCSLRINAGDYAPMRPDLEQRLHTWFRPHEEALAAFLAGLNEPAPTASANED